MIVRYATTTSSNVTSLTISSNGIDQASASGVNVFMGKVGIGANNPTEQLHVVGNVQVDGTNIVSAITLGEETRTNWPSGGGAGDLIATNNLADLYASGEPMSHKSGSGAIVFLRQSYKGRLVNGWGRFLEGYLSAQDVFSGWAAFHWSGRNSLKRLAGWALMRSKTSRR